MPRQTLRLPGTADLAAKRLAYERTRPDRDWSTAEVARRLTEAGFKISQSSVWSIENDPRRKITFAEAVAFADLYELTLDELTEIPQDISGEAVADLMREVTAVHRDGRAFRQRLMALLQRVNEFNDEATEELDNLFGHFGIDRIGVPLDKLKAQLHETAEMTNELADVLPDEGIVISFGSPGER